MKVLITGCDGQLGQKLTDILFEKNNIQLFACSRATLDITQQQQVAKFVSELKPDVIINAAAYTAVDRAESEVELCYAVNKDGPKFLAQAAQACGALLLHISTDYVFDGLKSTPYSESDTPTPLCIYGKSKLAGEIEITKYCRRYIIVRTAWVFSENGHNFVKTMLNLAKTQTKLNIVADQFGGPTYSGDLATTLIKIINRFGTQVGEINELFHYSGEPYVSWYEFAKAIIDTAKKYGVIDNLPVINPITSAQYPQVAIRPLNSRLNCKKIQQFIDCKPSNWQLALELIQVDKI